MNLEIDGSAQSRLPATAIYHRPTALTVDLDEMLALAAVAAAEAASRLGRQLPVRVVGAGRRLALPQWPASLRQADGHRVRAVVAALVEPDVTTADQKTSRPVATVPGAAPVDDRSDQDEHLLVIVDPVPVEAGAAQSGAAPVEAFPDNQPGRPVVSARIHGGPTGVTVQLHSTPADPWRDALAGVAELIAELFGALAADPALPPEAACGVGPTTRRLLLGRYAGREVDDGPFVAVPELIARRVDQDPDRTAICFRDRSLTYRELDELANGLAAALTTTGLRRGDVVPVLLADGLELPVAWLALMKLGVAFVPVDATWPALRLRTALDILAAPLVLCADGDTLPQPYGDRARPVRLDAITPTPARPEVRLHPDDLTYGIFTSGTTGVPKCAMNRHLGLANRFQFMTRYFRATGAEVVLQNSRHTFDSALWQLFWPLTTGGRAVVPPRDGVLNLPQIIDTIAAERVTITDFVPSVFNVLVSMADADGRTLARLTSLRQVIVGGEEINPVQVHRMRQLLPALSVTNGYGPSEASIGMVFHEVRAGDGDLVPLGRPIDNCYAVIVDDQLRLLPLGVVGEIVIGGRCLGDGYLGAPGRAAEAFLPNPFPQLPGERLYRTGDLGWFDAAGRLCFAGRRDFQVKINGVRIELGEIETAARSCPGVRQANVLAVTSGSGSALAVFVAGDATLTEPVLRGHLRRRLPRTSLPQHCLVLAELPVTDNGKVDRRRLRALLDEVLARDEANLDRATSGEPADLADQVLWVFRSVLRRPEVTAEIGFVDAGGDSLQALAVTRSLRAITGVALGVPDLFAHPTAAGLAGLIERRRAGPDQPVDAGAGDPAGGGVPPDPGPLIADAVLPTGLIRPGAIRREPPRAVLLTGATGFVGSRLLHHLLVTTDARLYCCVRAGDDAAATQRVIGALTERGLWQDRFADRIEGYAADLARPGLGLPEKTLTHLARSTDLILHNAALVNILYGYPEHRPANVRGTAQLLSLAMRDRPKPLHYISTLGVLDTEAARRGEPLREDHPPERAAVPLSGYSQSKWVAERMLAEARRQGAVVTVLRLGEVLPSADNTHPNQRALTHLLLSAFEQLNCCPAATIRSDYTPVDYVAARVGAAVADPYAWGRTLHVFHPESVCFADVLSRVGRPIPQVACAEFLTTLRQAAQDTGDRELATLLALLPAAPPGNETELRRTFGGLLTDNPRLFEKDQCRHLEQRWGLTDDWLSPAISAYRAWLAARRPSAGTRGPGERESLLLAASGPAPGG